MLNSIVRNPNQFNAAWYYERQNDDQGVYFEFSWEDDAKVKTKGTQGHNIIRDSINTRIRTDYQLNFIVGGYIRLSDENMYYIETIDEAVSNIAYQALSILRVPPHDTVLTLRLVQNTKAGRLT